MSRYRVPRICHDFEKTTARKCLKGIAALIFREESPSAEVIWSRTKELFSSIGGIVLGVTPDFEQTLDEMEAEKGVRPNATRLKDRADKWWRYGEYSDELLHLLYRAYSQVVVGRDPQRTFSFRVKQTVADEQEGKCAVCQAPFTVARPEGDHKTPWSRGGKTVKENCQILCARCNRDKKTMSAYEYACNYRSLYGVDNNDLV